jgi:prepilin-type processing-associated H-X9-DG protein
MGPLIGRHNGFCNVLFQDGSMAAFRPSEIDPRTKTWQINGSITNRLWRTTVCEWGWGDLTVGGWPVVKCGNQ